MIRHINLIAVDGFSYSQLEKCSLTLVIKAG